MRKFLRCCLVLAAVVLAAMTLADVRAQITIPNTFTAGTVADPDAVNSNFTALGTQGLNRTGGTMSGTLNSQAILPTANDTYALGDSTHRFTTGFFSGTVTAATFSGGFSGSGAGLTGILPTTLTGAGRIPMAADYWPAWASKTAIYTAVVTADDDLDCDATAGAFTITLPTPVGVTGKTFNVKKTDSSANACTVGTAGGLIDGAATFVISVRYQNMTFRSNGTDWEIR